MAILLSSNKDTGLEEWFHYDNLTGEVHIETRQNTDTNLDWAKRLKNDDEYTKKGIKNCMWHYAHIPPLVQVKWLNEYGIENWPMKAGNEKLLFKLLNSPDFGGIKTTRKIHTARG
jgi:hypothetical protein